MARGAEAYLQMWERAEGIAPDSCRNPGLRKRVAQVETLVRRGMTTTAGDDGRSASPSERLGSTYGSARQDRRGPEGDDAGPVLDVPGGSPGSSGA